MPYFYLRSIRSDDLENNIDNEYSCTNSEVAIYDRQLQSYDTVCYSFDLEDPRVTVRRSSPFTKCENYITLESQRL